MSGASVVSVGGVADRERFDVSGVSHGLKTLTRIDLVRALLIERPGLRLADIVAHTGWPAGTAAGVMSDMRARGIVSASWKEGYRVVEGGTNGT